MKKSLFILLALVSLAANAQLRNVSLAADTVKGAETIYFAPSFNYVYSGTSLYAGLVGFQFTKTDVADSLSVLKMQGSYDGTNYVDLTSTTSSLTNTTTNGNFFLYEVNPVFLKYRLLATCASGDTVRFSNVRYIHKDIE